MLKQIFKILTYGLGYVAIAVLFYVFIFLMFSL